MHGLKTVPPGAFQSGRLHPPNTSAEVGEDSQPSHARSRVQSPVSEPSGVVTRQVAFPRCSMVIVSPADAVRVPPAAATVTGAGSVPIARTVKSTRDCSWEIPTHSGRSASNGSIGATEVSVK